MNGLWDLYLEAELAYRRERIAEDYRRSGGRRRSRAALREEAVEGRPGAGVVRPAGWRRRLAA